MEESPIGHLYNVYKIIDQKNQSQLFISEGPGTLSHDREFVGPLISDLNCLPQATVRDHLEYLKSEGYTHVSKENDLYMTFSFTPSCHRVLHSGKIYITDSLDENEQDQFSKGIEKVHESLEGYIDFERTSNPLE